MKKENTGSTKKAGRLEKVLVPLLIVLVSLLSYSVGILSGKRLSDREYAMKGGELKHESSHEAGAEEHAAADDDEMTDEEINNVANAAMENAENPSATSNGAVAAQSPNSITQPGTSAHGAAPIPANTAAPSLAKNEAAAGHAPASVAHAAVAKKSAVKEEDRAPSSINKKASDTLQYTVQVASYSDFKDAEAMAIALHKKGYPAFSFKVDIKGQTWHRVSIGGYKTKKEAETLQSELVKQGVVKDSYVQKLTR